MERNEQGGAAGVARFVGVAMGVIFAGIGVTVLVFLWGAPFGEFGSPPVFFRVFGSFIALGFVVFGGAMGVGALKARGAQLGSPARSEVGASGGSAGYRCPHCGAPLGEKAEVSPSGDVKCGFCGRWFNVHGR